MAVVAGGAALASGGIRAAGQLDQGQREAEAQEIAARQEEAQGRDEFAIAQREAREKKLELALVQSRQQAIAAASGGGAGVDAPTIVTLMQKTAERGRYGMESVMYAGQRRKDSLFASADSRRRTGQNAIIGSRYSAAGSLLGGIGDFAGSLN